MGGGGGCDLADVTAFHEVELWKWSTPLNSRCVRGHSHTGGCDAIWKELKFEAKNKKSPFC